MTRVLSLWPLALFFALPQLIVLAVWFAAWLLR
jgi:hypothetical protein